MSFFRGQHKAPYDYNEPSEYYLINIYVCVIYSTSKCYTI